MLSLGLPLSVLGQEQPMFFKMFVCLWLKFGSIISFSLLGFLFWGGWGVIHVTYFPYISWSELLISSCQVLSSCTLVPA